MPESDRKNNTELITFVDIIEVIDAKLDIINVAAAPEIINNQLENLSTSELEHNIAIKLAFASS